MRRATGGGASYRNVDCRSDYSSVRFVTRLACLAMVLLLTAASAQGSLYGPDAPRDTAYVRVINARTDGPVSPVVAGSEWEDVAFAEVSPYRQVPPGEHQLSLGDGQASFSAEPESFTTIIALDEEILVLVDTPLRDISRGLLTLYNLTGEGPISLHAGDGTEVIAGVEPRSAQSLAISEAEVALTVQLGEDTLGTLEERLYRRGEAHAVVVLPLGSEPQIVYARAGAER